MRAGATHDDFETRYWLNTAVAGAWVTILMTVAGFAYLVCFAEADHRLGLGPMLAFDALLGGAELSGSVRAGDAVARLGGDEFAVLLPDTAPAAAEPVITRLSSTLAERAPHCLGIASAPEQGASFDDLYRNADAALYERKLLRPPRNESPQPVEPDPSCA